MKKYILGTLFFLVPFFIISQEIISSTNGDSSGSGGSSSYTIGQVFFNTIESDNGSLVQGVQQPFEFQTLSTPALLTVQLTAVTYPNPTTDFVLLKILDTALENLQYTLFDLNGKTIVSKKINSFSTKITMKNFAIGMYLLKITKNNQPLKTFKIIKKQ
ncbi:T9SS type A sorting domain-containing protein [Flavobacteriaceae bacterium]|nr:T9SS type A sorting domain-containing protein [Flavobacteriaceae bacterium]